MQTVRVLTSLQEQNVHTGSGTHPASPIHRVPGFLSRGQSGHGVMMTTHLQLAPRLRMSGGIRLCPMRLHGVGRDNFSLLIDSMEQRPSLEANRSSASQEDSPHFMETEGSLLHSQEPVTCPYPEPDWSSPCPHPTSRRSILILFSHLCLGLSSGLLPSVFTPKANMHLYSRPYMLHVLPISVFFYLITQITFGEQYRA